MPLPSGTWSIATIEVALRDGNLHTVGHIFNPLTTDDALWHCLTFAACYHAVGAICFKDKFCASKKGAIGRGGRVSTQLG